MKKIIYLIVIAVIAASVVSCGGNKNQKKDEKTTDTTQTENATVKNLKQALTMEFTNVKKYEQYAQKAKEEKFTAIAALFMAAAKSAEIHAHNHQLVLEELRVTFEPETGNFEVKTTQENLASAIEKETIAVDEIYPEYTEQASNENISKAVKSFGWAHESEIKFLEYYQMASDALKNNKQNTLPSSYFVCPKCGFTYTNKNVEENCELCGTAKDKFVNVK